VQGNTTLRVVPRKSRRGALCHDGVLWRGPDFGSYLLLVESVMPLPLPDVTPLATHEL
jgi:hypothetical protein